MFLEWITRFYYKCNIGDVNLFIYLFRNSACNNTTANNACEIKLFQCFILHVTTDGGYMLDRTLKLYQNCFNIISNVLEFSCNLANKISLIISLCVCDAVGRVIQTLPDREPVCGVTSLDNRLYVLRGSKSTEQIEVYDVDSYDLLHCLTVPGFGAVDDIVACAHNRCAYIADWLHNSIHRVALPDAAVTLLLQRPAVTRWPVNDKPARLSLTATHGVLVTCDKVSKMKEYSTDGQLLRVLTLPEDVVSPWHAIQLSSGEFIVCHGRRTDPALRVCLIGSDGSVVNAYGGPCGSGRQQMDVPAHLAVDRNEFVCVVDQNNDRVLLLSPMLTNVREVVSRKQLKWKPRRVHLDSHRGLLYVADNEYKGGKWTTGRVLVVSV